MSHIWRRLVTYMNRPCHTLDWPMAHISMSHGTYEYFVAHINEPYYVRMSHFTHKNVTSHTFKWAMAHTWMIHGTHMNESWHIWMSRGMVHMNESWRIWMSHVSQVNNPCHMGVPYYWVMSHTRSSHFTHAGIMSLIYESCHLWMTHITPYRVMLIAFESCHARM